MAPIVITEAEILDALAAAAKGTGPKSAKTIAEMADDTRRSLPKVRTALARLKRDGRLVVHQVIREGLDGRQCRVSAYTILPKKK